jgi:hypothetical protein
MYLIRSFWLLATSVFVALLAPAPAPGQTAADTIEIYAAVLGALHAEHPGRQWAFANRTVSTCGWHCRDLDAAGRHPDHIVEALRSRGLVADACIPEPNRTGCIVDPHQSSVSLSAPQTEHQGETVVTAILGMGGEYVDVRTVEYALRRGADGRWQVVYARLRSIT